METHIEPRIENDLLWFAVNVLEEAKIELKHIGIMKGKRNVVTSKNKSYCIIPRN